MFGEKLSHDSNLKKTLFFNYLNYLNYVYSRLTYAAQMNSKYTAKKYAIIRYNSQKNRMMSKIRFI